MFMNSYCYVYVFLLLRMFCSLYSVSLCCSAHSLCANVYCTSATVCQPNRSQQIYRIIFPSQHIKTNLVNGNLPGVWTSVYPRSKKKLQNYTQTHTHIRFT